MPLYFSDGRRACVHGLFMPCDYFIDGPNSPYKAPFNNVGLTKIQRILTYINWISIKPKLIARARRELRGKVLGSWYESSHAEVLALLVNSDIVIQLCKQEDPTIESIDFTS